MTLRMKARAKIGSTPLETPAMMEMVPVGAMVVRVALRTRLAPRCPGALVPVGEDAPVARQLLAGLDGLLVDEAHHLVAEPDGVVAVVADAELHQHVGPTHDPKAHLAVALGHRADLGERVAVHVDDVVEEVRRRPRDPAQPLPIDVAVLHHDG